jgi:type VI secretion system secreted protein VgrG
LTHDTDENGNAPGNDVSGTWVRVAEALAGPNWGSQFTPRIGTEVLNSCYICLISHNMSKV